MTESNLNVEEVEKKFKEAASGTVTTEELPSKITSITKKSSWKAKKQKQKEEEKQRRAMMMPTTKHEFIGAMKDIWTRVNFLQAYITKQDDLINAMRKAILDNGICTEDELAEKLAYERARTSVYQKISNTNSSYEERLKLCEEWSIQPRTVFIQKHLDEDEKISADDKKMLIDRCGELDVKFKGK